MGAGDHRDQQVGASGPGEPLTNWTPWAGPEVSQVFALLRVTLKWCFDVEFPTTGGAGAYGAEVMRARVDTDRLGLG